MAALVGLIVKRLAGLEAMITIQLAWISILWMNSKLYLAFTKASPLKYSTGPNFNLFPQTAYQNVTAAITGSSKLPEKP